MGSVRAISRDVAATGTGFTQLYGWAVPGEVVEVSSQDCFVTWSIAQRVDDVERVEYTRTGPAGSRARFTVDEFLVVKYRVDFLFASTEHADPATGAYQTGAGVRKARVETYIVGQAPVADTWMPFLVDGTDAPSAPANAITALGYAPGYARIARIAGVPAVPGWLQTVAPSGAGVFGRYPFQPVVEMPVSPWDLLSFDNQSAAVVQPLNVLWLPKASPSVPSTELSCLSLPAVAITQAAVIVPVGVGTQGDVIPDSCELGEVYVILAAIAGGATKVTWYIAEDAAGDVRLTPNQTDTIAPGQTAGTGGVARTLLVPYRRTTAGPGLLYAVLALDAGTANATVKMSVTPS